MFFQNSVIKKYLAALNNEQVTAAWEVYKAYFLNQEIQAKRARFLRRLQDNLPDIKIATTDRDIDTRVYALYGLTEEEIKVIEG